MKCLVFQTLLILNESNITSHDTSSYEHMEKQLPKYRSSIVPSSPTLVSGNRLPEQARRGWEHEEGTMVHKDLGRREPNHLEQAFCTPNNRFYRRKKAREARMAKATPMDVDTAKPAQERLAK